MAQTRASILRAARPILLRDGLGGSTLDRVAADGGIAKMTLYRHFPNKEALFEGLVIAMCETMREGLENARPAGTDRSSAIELKAALGAFVSALIEPDALRLYRLVVAEGWRFPGLAFAFDQSGMRVIRQRIADILAAGSAAADQSRLVAAEVVALALGDAYQRAVLGISEEEDHDAFARQIEAAVSYGLTRSLASDPHPAPVQDTSSLNVRGKSLK